MANSTPRTEDEILLSALENERKTLEKSLQTIKAKAYDPTMDFIEARTALLLAVKDGPPAFRKATAEYERQRALLDKYQKVDVVKLLQKQATLDMEIRTIDQMIYFASRRLKFVNRLD